MPKWEPSAEWRGEDAYVVGGGPSLGDFDWALLRGKNTIGCNSVPLDPRAAGVIKIAIWADYLWWTNIGREGLANFGGRVVHAPASRRRDVDLVPWLLLMDRSDSNGLDTEKLGFNGNTGSLALNLALILGARRVFLLGFDMKLSQEGRANFHDLRYEAPNPQSYPSFIQEFAHVARDLPIKFPGREVWNVTRDSALPYFPKVTPEAHFGQEG